MTFLTVLTLNRKTGSGAPRLEIIFPYNDIQAFTRGWWHVETHAMSREKRCSHFQLPGD